MEYLNSIKLFMAIFTLSFIYIFAAWSIFLFIQYCIVSYGNTKWINSIDNQLSKHDCYTPFDTHMNIGTRFLKYCFQFPFIYKRATTKDKKFYIILTFNSISVYTIITLFFLGLSGIVPIN